MKKLKHKEDQQLELGHRAWEQLSLELNQAISRSCVSDHSTALPRSIKTPNTVMAPKMKELGTNTKQDNGWLSSIKIFLKNYWHWQILTMYYMKKNRLPNNKCIMIPILKYVLTHRHMHIQILQFSTKIFNIQQSKFVKCNTNKSKNSITEYITIF